MKANARGFNSPTDSAEESELLAKPFSRFPGKTGVLEVF
jgi:hypothetical protein